MKWVVIILLPAINTFIFTLGGLLGFNSEIICGVISAVTVLIGALIGVSSYTYTKEKANE